MPYRQYKTSYSDCETVYGSYNSFSKTIEVNVPDERIKPSGVRGEHFHGYQLWLIDEKGEYGFCTYRAVSNENAMKQHVKWCKKTVGNRANRPPEKLQKYTFKNRRVTGASPVMRRHGHKSVQKRSLK